MNIENKLYEEIEACFNRMADAENPTSDEYKANVEAATKLMDRAIEMEKVDKSAAQNEKQIDEERKARLAKNIIDVGAIVLPLCVTIWGAKASFKFEEEGTITTSIGRKFMDKLIKK